METSPTAALRTPRPRRRLQLALLYFLALVREFRWTLVVLLVALAIAALLYATTRQRELDGQRPPIPIALYAGWMALLAQPIYNPPAAWYLMLVNALYPVFGVLLIGEGVVRFALLMISKKLGEKEWMRVMASTFRDHVVLCGIGHLGTRVLEELVGSGAAVVVLEKDEDSRLLAITRELKVPVLIRDMKEDQALIDAGVNHARAIIIATNDDMANLEVALDARRLNPKIRVLMRLFDQQIAAKISDALSLDVAFSSAALAAPIIAAMCLETKVHASVVIAGVVHSTSEVSVQPGSVLAGVRIDEMEQSYAVRVLARTRKDGGSQTPPAPAESIEVGDALFVFCPISNLTRVSVDASSPMTGAR